jgi:hypothetical protein
MPSASVRERTGRAIRAAVMASISTGTATYPEHGPEGSASVNVPYHGLSSLKAQFDICVIGYGEIR